MGRHKPAAEAFYNAITSKDIRDYKTIKQGSKIHFQHGEGERTTSHHLCWIKIHASG